MFMLSDLNWSLVTHLLLIKCTFIAIAINTGSNISAFTSQECNRYLQKHYSVINTFLNDQIDIHAYILNINSCHHKDLH